MKTKDQLRQEVVRIVVSNSKTGNFAENYTKLYKKYNSVTHRVSLKNEGQKNLQEIYDADRIEELHYAATQLFLKNHNLTPELKHKIEKENEKQRKAIFKDKKDYREMLRPATEEDILKIFSDNNKI